MEGKKDIVSVLMLQSPRVNLSGEEEEEEEEYIYIYIYIWVCVCMCVWCVCVLQICAVGETHTDFNIAALVVGNTRVSGTCNAGR